MILSYRIFDYSGTALAPTTRSIGDIKTVFKENHQIKRIEIYERKEGDSIWDETYLKTYHAKDFK